LKRAATEEAQQAPALLEGRSSKGGRPSREVAAQLRNHLLEVALRAYCEHGLDGVTLSEIAQEAQVSKRTLYTRFKDRETLLVDAIEHGIERLITPISTAIPDGTLRDQLLFLGGEMMQISLRPEVIGLERLIALVQYRIPDVYQRVSGTIQKGRLSLIESLLSSAADRGEIEEESIHIAASIVFDILVTQPRRELLAKPIAKGDATMMKAYLQKAIDLMLYGIYLRPQQDSA
jgi:AcrR family transcriptional regulator